MNALLPVVFASVAAIGNAMFVVGQKQSGGSINGLLFVALSAFVAFVASVVASPFVGRFAVKEIVSGHWAQIVLSGLGLFLTYVGFNLLYSRFGASQYVLYAVISIITTTVIVGALWLKEPLNAYQCSSIVLAIGAVVLFSVGAAKA